MNTPNRLRISLAVLATLLSCANAHAGLFRAFLKSTGSDANSCTLQAPCRLLPAALAAIDAGGEVWMLDSANYNTGPVTISKSVSIRAIPGALGSLVGTQAGPALSIDASQLTVSLKNLSIRPLSRGDPHGIVVSGASTLEVEDCAIEGFSGEALNMGGAGKLRVSRTLFAGNLFNAVDIRDGVDAHLSDVTMVRNATAINVEPSAGFGALVTLTDSILADGGLGVLVQTAGGGDTARASIVRTTISGMTGTALLTENGGVLGGSQIVDLKESLVTQNAQGWFVGGTGIINVFGDNDLTGNGPNVGSLTPVARR